MENDIIIGGVPVIFDDTHFMHAALRCAEEAFEAGEVPVGAVAVDPASGRILARAWNQVEMLKDATAHAEVLIISSLASLLGDWRLDSIDIYVTKEPCAMCAGAMVNARVRRVIYGMADPRSGCAGSALNVTGFQGMLHQVTVVGGILAPECTALMREFFQSVRGKKDLPGQRSCTSCDF